MKKILLKPALFAITGLLFSYNATAQFAQVQAIHNSPDPAAQTVDIWVSTALGSSKLYDDFAFRTAKPFQSVPAGVPVTLSVAPANSTTVADTIPGLSIRATLTNNERYVLMALGNVGSTFAPNPNGLSTSFQFLPLAGIRATSTNPNNVDVLVVHAVTDAPGVDVYAKGISTPIISDLKYLESSTYLELPAANYYLDVTAAGTTQSVAFKKAPLSGLAGSAIVVFASGYLDPASNGNGPAFGLYAALANGTVIELSSPTASLQVIHNAADPAAAQVDVYLDDTRILNDFAFRTATPFVTVPAERNFTVGIAGGGSSSVADTLVSFDFELNDGENYIVFANGVLNPASFAANPESLETAFGLKVLTPARKVAEDNTLVDLALFHGATDAPEVGVFANDSKISSIAYGSFDGYLSVAPGSYNIRITPANVDSITVVQYTADISNAAGKSLTLFASGFLAPSDNQLGPDFGLYVVDAEGNVTALPTSFASVKPVAANRLALYPNPASDKIFISGETATSGNYSIVNLMGQEVLSGVWNSEGISVNNLPKGMYILIFETETSIKTNRFIVE